MNLILHQFKTDWRHFRSGLLLLWLTYAVNLLFAWPLLPDAIYNLRQDLLPFLQVLAAVCLVPQIIQADNLVGATAQWLTRPLRRPHLFGAKSAFILVCVVLPRLAPQIVLCATHHYPLNAALASVAGLLLTTLAVVSCMVALAALTPDLPRFFLGLSGLLVIFFIWAALLSMHYRHAPAVPESLGNSASTAALLLLAGGALVVWILQVFAGRPTLGFVLLGGSALLLPVLEHAWSPDFLAAHLTPLPPLAISFVDPTNIPAATGANQRLWSAFNVASLPPHHLLVAENGQPAFNPNGKTNTYNLGPFRTDMFYQRDNGPLGDRVLPMESGQQSDYVAAIHDFFPPETLWNDLPVHNWGGFPSTEEVFRAVTNRPVLGGLYWWAEFDEFQVAAALRVPLRRGVWQLAPGHQFTIQDIIPGPNGVTLNVGEIIADPPLLPSIHSYIRHDGRPSQSFCTCVLYHPAGGQAELLGNQLYANNGTDLLTGETRQTCRFEVPYPVLPARLLGLTLQQYLDQATLCVFLPVYQGTFHQTFQQNNFDLARVQSQSTSAGDDLKNVAAIAALTLPAIPTQVQINQYLDNLLPRLPENNNSTWQPRIQSRLEAIGTAGIPLLLARLPLESRAERDYIFPLLTQFATRAQLPELQAALTRDLNLAGWFHQMKWDVDARDVLLRLLPDHRQAFSAVTLRMAATAHDPATYPDLAWHFVRLGNQQKSVAEVLSQCPGFDLDGTIREAWQRVQWGLTSPGDLPVLAARQGLPNAFNRAVIQLENSNNSAQHRQAQALQITALTDFSGTPETAQTWLSANLGRFQYDPARRVYLLPAMP